jgi:hypothetical protein
MGLSGLAQPMGFLRRFIITGREGWVIAEAGNVLSLKKHGALSLMTLSRMELLKLAISTDSGERQSTPGRGSWGRRFQTNGTDLARRRNALSSRTASGMEYRRAVEPTKSIQRPCGVDAGNLDYSIVALLCLSVLGPLLCFCSAAMAGSSGTTSRTFL